MSNTERFYKDALESAKALASKGNLTNAERVELKARMSKVESLKAAFEQEQKLRKQANADLGSGDQYGSTSGNDFAAALKRSGFDRETKPRVTLPSIGAKALMSDGTDGNINGTVLGLAAYGRGDQFAFQSFPTFGLGNATSVQALRQTARTLATPSDMDVPITGSSAKPESVVTLALQTVDAVMIAHVTEALPNALFGLGTVNQFVRDELAYGLGRGIDSFLITTITGASGTQTLSQGVFTLLDTYREAQRLLAVEGYKGDLLLVNPTDSAAIDTIKSADDRYLAHAGPVSTQGFTTIWDAKVVETTAVTAGSPVLIDSQRYGKLLLGGTKFDVNSYSTPDVDLFATNQCKARLETPALVAVQLPKAVVEITLGA